MKNPPNFQGKLVFSVTGVKDGQAWTQNLPEQLVKLSQYQRVAGSFVLPPDVKVQSLTVKLLEQGIVRATQTIKVSP